MPKLRVIPTELLMPDPDVQLDFALQKRRIKAMSGEAWNKDFAIVLVVVPLHGEHEGMYGIVDGRHRFLAGQAVESEWRCDVHEDVTTVDEKARLKLAIDQQRRRVRPIEHFMERLLAEDADALAIQRIVEDAGFEIGKLSSGSKPYHRFEVVTALERIYLRLGERGLRRTLVLNTHWKGDPKSNTGEWITALALLVRDGYDEVLTPRAWEKLGDVVPAQQLRRARGAIEGAPGGGSPRGGWGAMTYQVARQLRRASGLRRRPAVGGGNSQSL